MSIEKTWTEETNSLNSLPVEYIKYRVDSQEELEKMNAMEEKGWKIHLPYCINEFPDGRVERDKNGCIVRYYLLEKAVSESERLLYFASYNIYEGSETLAEDCRYVTIISRDANELCDRMKKVNNRADWVTTVFVEKDWLKRINNNKNKLNFENDTIVLAASARNLKKIIEQFIRN